MKLNIVDANYELNRAGHASLNTQLSNSQGAFTGGLYYFLKAMYSYLDVGIPVAVLDGGHSKKRKEISPTYKENRKREEIPEDQKTFEDIRREQTFNLMFKIIPQLLPKMGIPVIRIRGEEADDVVYRLAKFFQEAGNEVTVTSDDFDYFQNLKLGVKVFRARENMIYDREIFTKKYCMNPDDIPILKAITGDPKDDVHGVKGVGDKTVMKMFEEMKAKELPLSVEGVKKYIALNSKLASKLAGKEELIEMNFKLKDLATAPITDAEVLNAYKEAKALAIPDAKYVMEVFKELEFNSLGKWILHIQSRA